MGTGPALTNLPTLYGITNSNRSGGHLWGKNEFNSTFPTALACYMRDHQIPAVYLTVGPDLQITANEISIGELFNTDKPNVELHFDFESRYEPYQQYSLDDIGVIDLVVKHNGDESPEGWRRPLEIKLTVLPDDGTSSLPEAEWSPELVIRAASTKYCALSIYDACKAKRNEIRDIFQDVCGNFQFWDSVHELRAKRDDVLAALNTFQTEFRTGQRPFLVEPIWKTEGKSPSLADHAFDLFVWSDLALCRAFIDGAIRNPGQINRQMRASARLARVLYMLATQGRASLSGIYTGMTYDLLNDKEFSLSGRLSRQYLNTPRRLHPQLPKEVVAELILGGGQSCLSPERRFDATIYFTAHEIFETRRAIIETAVETAVEVANAEEDSTSTS